MLLFLFSSANRDEAIFEEPDKLELDRPNAHKHLAFEKGLHSCPNEPMARAEIRSAVGNPRACVGSGSPPATNRHTSPAICLEA